MNVVHLSLTPLAGGPYRLATAIDTHTSHTSRLVDLHRWNRFPHDIVFDEDKEFAVEIIRSADLLHVYNGIDLNTTSFGPIDLREMHSNGIPILRHFRSDPATVVATSQTTLSDIRNCSLPAVVIAQYPERYYPNAYVVRNNIPLRKAVSQEDTKNSNIAIVYTPSKRTAAFESRWNTKGLPETRRMLRHVRKTTGAQFRILRNATHAEVLAAKQSGYIVVDDLVTGSYHVSGLEGLSFGKPTLAHLDARTELVLREMTGNSSIPFVNVPVEAAAGVLAELVQDRSMGAEIGQNGRRWLEAHWSEADIAADFAEIYDRLHLSPTRLVRQPELQIDREVQKFFAVTLPDLIHQTRVARQLPLLHRMRARSISMMYSLLGIAKEVVRRRQDLLATQKQSHQ